jgi:hypothetical protein
MRRVVLVSADQIMIPRNLVSSQVTDDAHFASLFLCGLWRIETGPEIGRSGWNLGLLVLNGSVLEKQMMNQHVSRGLLDVS